MPTVPRNHPDYMKQYYVENKESLKIKVNKYRKFNNEYFRKMSVKYKEEHPEQYLWSNAKYRAKKNGFEFNIEISDVVIPKYCPYLGTELTATKNRGHLRNLMSVDRIDSSKGYIKGNVEVISYMANAMKQNATKDELLIFSKNVLLKFSSELENK